MSDWWADFFDDDYRRAAAPMLDPERTRVEVEALVEALDLDDALDLDAARPRDVLDICGGAGRVARPLAALGHRVTVVDRSLSMLVAGSAEVERVQADARALPIADRTFDIALNLFSSLGYFEDDDEHVQVLREAARVLRPGGRLVLGLTHRDHFVRTLDAPRTWYPLDDGTAVCREFEFDPIEGRSFEALYMTDEEGEPVEKMWSCRVFTATEIARMLRQAGLEPEVWYGDHDLSPFTSDAPRMIVVARTRSQDPSMSDSPEPWRDLLERLACPQTNAALAPMDGEALAALKASIEAGLARTLQGEPVAPLDGALLREDAAVAYPVRDGIPQLLAVEAIDLRSDA